MPLTGPAKPHPKDMQLARGEKRHHRKVASAKTWQKIVDAKKGVCRCSAMGGCAGPITYHHLLSRAQGGGDVADNIVPLCEQHHREITARHSRACRALLSALTDAEYAHLVTEGGEDVFERAYGLVYERAA